MNFEHLTPSSIMETKLSFPLQSLSQPSLSSTGKNSVEWYKMKAIIFPVVAIFSQNFLPEKRKIFLSYRNCFQKGREVNAVNSNHTRG